MSERRFSDKEMNAIIQRATELQMRGSADSSGATLAQIQQAASELGIAGELVERAAAEIQPERAGKRFSFFGGPLRADVSLVANRVLGQDDWPLFLHEIRKVTGRIGTAKPVGNAFEWSSQSPTGMHLAVTPKQGKSQIDIRLDLGPAAGARLLLPWLLVFPIGVSLVRLAGPSIGVPILAALILLVYTLGRISFRRASLRNNRWIRGVAEAVAGYIEGEGAVEVASTQQEAESTPLRITSR